MRALVWRAMARSRGLFSAVSVMLVVFQAAVVAVAASLEQDRAFEGLIAVVPSVLKEGLGPALASFGGLTTLSFYEPVIVLLIVEFAIFLAAEPAADVETGLVDLVLARPIARHRLITRSIIVMTAAALLMPLIMAAALWLCLVLLAPDGARWPEAATVAILGVHLVAVTWCFGGAGLAVAAASNRRGTAVAIAGVAAIACYLLDSIGDAWADAAWLAWMSPFHAFHGARILLGTTEPARDLTVLFVLGAAGVAVAYRTFQRRDM